MNGPEHYAAAQKALQESEHLARTRILSPEFSLAQAQVHAALAAVAAGLPQESAEEWFAVLVDKPNDIDRYAVALRDLTEGSMSGTWGEFAEPDWRFCFTTPEGMLVHMGPDATAAQVAAAIQRRTQGATS